MMSLIFFTQKQNALLATAAAPQAPALLGRAPPHFRLSTPDSTEQQDVDGAVFYARSSL
jgi:hypothetical protein